MGWIGNPSNKATATTTAPAAPAAPPSLEIPTMVSGRGLAPAQAIVEHITACEARLRTVVFFDHNAHVEFTFGLQGRPIVIARGRVTSRAQKGPRFTYRVVLERMSGAEADELARIVNEVHRRLALSRSLERSVRNLPTTEGLTRTCVRVDAHFPVQFRTPKENFRTAQAANVSAGGLMITTNEALVEGMAVELKFTLPSDVLEAYPEQTAVLDLRNRTIVSTGRSDLRRPFEEIVVLARVASHRVNGNGSISYGLAFHNIDGYSREEIARYAHAFQLAKKRGR